MPAQLELCQTSATWWPPVIQQSSIAASRMCTCMMPTSLYVQHQQAKELHKRYAEVVQAGNTSNLPDEHTYVA